MSHTIGSYSASLCGDGRYDTKCFSGRYDWPYLGLDLGRNATLVHRIVLNAWSILGEAFGGQSTSQHIHIDGGSALI